VFGVQASPAVQATHAPALQTRFVPQDVPLVTFPDSMHTGAPVLHAVGRSFNATPRQTFWLIAFPAAVPAIVTGIRLALIYALVNTIGLEFLIDFGGLGRVISDLYAQYDIPQMYAEIGVVVVISAAILIGAEVFGAAFAGGWALAILFGLDDIGAHILQAVLFAIGVFVMINFVRAAQRVEPFIRRA